MFLEHINLTVSDVAASVDFYRRLFDFEVRWQGTNSAGRPAAHVGDHHNYLALFEAAGAGQAEESYDRVGINHLGFVVDDLEVQRQRLVALSIEPHLEADYEPGRRLYFRDPDGIEVELVEYPAKEAKLAGGGKSQAHVRASDSSSDQGAKAQEDRESFEISQPRASEKAPLVARLDSRHRLLRLGNVHFPDAGWV